MSSIDQNRQAVASRKYFVLAVLLVLLTLPHVSHEFNFRFGGGDGDNDDAATKQVTKRTTEKKFKFRKIERIYVDDYVEDNDDEAADGGHQAKSDDIDDDDDDNNVRESRYERAAADSSRKNENEEFQFERARKAHKERSNNQPNKVQGRKTTAARDDHERKISDVNNDESLQSESYLSSLFHSLFGGAKKTPNDKVKVQKEAAKSSNGIIDWLKWLGEKSGRLKPPPPEPEESNLDILLSYFNRWPFNSFFPIGKQDKPIRMPRRTAANRAGDSIDDDNAQVEPMSQEHFESLLHTLPGFVINATHVNDIECRQQMQIFHRQLRGNKLWTLQMLDATGKISSGLLRGNINQFGDFDMCTQVKTLVKVTPDIPMRIRGKYCLAHIETQTAVPALKVPVHLAHGRGLWNGHLGNPSHFVPRYAVANWGVCIPNMCSADVVREMIETNLRPYNTTGIEFHVEVDDNDCSMRQSKKFTKLFNKHGKFGVTILYIASLALLMLTSLIYEYWTVIKEFLQSKLKATKSTSEADSKTEALESAEETTGAEEDIAKEVQNDTAVEEEQTEEAAAKTTIDASDNTSLKLLAREIFISFSPRRTLTELLSEERLDLQFPIFHLLKLFATFMLYICLKYLMIGHLPITNREQLVRAVDQPFSIVFRAPMIYTDILLLITGFLSAYQLSEEMAQKSYIQLLKRLVSKVARCLPTLYVVLFFQTWVLPHLGSGPLWSNIIGQNARLCEQQMWRNIFSAQNAIVVEETCSPMTLQLALEMQLYLLAPLIVWLYYTDSDAGFFVYGAIHVMSVAARFSRTNREHLSITLFHGMNVSKFYRTANILYASPISRATPYLLGIGAGLLHRTQEGSLQIAPEIMPIGWCLALFSIIWCFWAPSSGMHTDFIYTSSDAASYASWSPLILGLALFWIIFMFPKSDNSILTLLTTSRPILFLSRITFPMQLVMYVVIMYNTASVKDSLKYHIADLVNFHEIIVIVAFATMLAFIIDVPSQHIRRLLVNRIFIERSQNEQEPEPVSGAEQSEGEPSEDRTCDTPEPSEAVWSSDPEEEEQKYITRRRSSTIIKEEEEEKETTKAAEAEPDEEEEEDDIAEEDEVKKRPATPPPPPPAAAVKQEKEEAPKTSYTRRRRPTSDD